MSLLLVFCILTSIAKPQLLPDQLSKIRMVSEVSVSPDGQMVAFTLVSTRPLSDGAGAAFRELYLHNLGTGTNIPLLTGKVVVGSPGWSPDGRKVTFRQSNSGTKGMQVFAVNQDGSDIQQLTYLDRPVIAYEFIDAETLVITAKANPEESKSSLLQKGFDFEVVEEELQPIDLMRYDLQTRETVNLTRKVTVFDFTVSPDAKMIAAAIAPENTVDASYMFKRIHILDAADGRVLEKIENPGKLDKMTWSPDSRKLAFQASAMLEDAVAGSLFVFETGKGLSYSDLKNLVSGLELSVIDIAWKDSNALLFASEESVDVTIRELDINRLRSTLVIAPGVHFFNGFEYNAGKYFFAGHTAAHPQELMVFDSKTGYTEQLTNHNPWLDMVRLANQEKISWKSRDGMNIEGVLMYPLDYQKGKSYPLITYIHGGPEAAVQNGWLSNYSTWGQFAAARSFFVFYPNYRASSGRGVDFTMAGYGDLVGKEYEDVLDGIDHLIEQGFVDKSKVGIGGGSYGGYFAAWSATRYTERFAASVVFVGVTNQVSKRNTTDIPMEDYHVHWGFWTHENFEKVWGASPVKYAHQSKTPTLILHGENDQRIPLSQGKELYTALKINSEAPVRMVIYPGEGHGNAKNTNRYDFLIRTLDWFEYYLVKNPGAKTLPDKYFDYPE